MPSAESATTTCAQLSEVAEPASPKPPSSPCKDERTDSPRSTAAATSALEARYGASEVSAMAVRSTSGTEPESAQPPPAISDSRIASTSASRVVCRLPSGAAGAS